MKEFVSKWSNWWILNPKRKQLDDAFEKELNELIEREVALRQPPVIGSVCTCRNSELEKGSLVPVFCHTCNAYVQTDL